MKGASRCNPVEPLEGKGELWQVSDEHSYQMSLKLYNTENGKDTLIAWRAPSVEQQWITAFAQGYSKPVVTNLRMESTITFTDSAKDQAVLEGMKAKWEAEKGKSDSQWKMVSFEGNTVKLTW